MSQDKLRDLTPVDVNYSPGERPTDEKLEGGETQTREALEYLEATIGDAFGESLETNLMYISNLSRDLGDRSKLNPILKPDVSLVSYIQNLTIGEMEHELDLIPIGNGAPIISSSADTSVLPSQYKTSVSLLEIEGDWTIPPGLVEGGIEKNSRKLVTHSPSSGGTVTFANVTSGRGSSFVGASHSVIPSKAQAEDGGPFLTVALSDAINNIYTIQLPTETVTETRLHEIGTPSISNTKVAIGGGQQMELPAWLFDVAGLDMGANDPETGQGKLFPLNVVRIYDWQNKKVIDGLLEVKASGSAGSRKWEIICTFRSDIILDTVSGEYLLATSGTSITEYINALASDLYFHKHMGDDMIRGIKHSDTFGLRTGDTGGSRTNYYGPSDIDNNDHSMYFHRDGFVDGDVGAGGNIIRGNVVIGNTDLGMASMHEHYNLTADSRKLYFGDTSTASQKIFYDKVKEQTLPLAWGTIPSTYSDTAMVITPPLDDATSLERMAIVEGHFRVEGDVVLGTTVSNNVYITGEFRSKDLQVSALNFTCDSPTVTFPEFSADSANCVIGANITSMDRLRIHDGSLAEPSLAFNSDTDTGIRRVSAGSIAVVGDGVDRFVITTSYIQSNHNHRFVDGLETSPSMTFTADTDTGFYRYGDGDIGIASNGGYHSRFDSDGNYYGTATAALYSDLAERYAADEKLEAGDVVKIGGYKEITKTKEEKDMDVFGVISTNPAYMMNEKAGNDDTHPYVALAGRVPCKVLGKVKKGDRLVSSDLPGVAKVLEKDEACDNILAIIGRALEGKEDYATGKVEIVIGKL